MTDNESAEEWVRYSRQFLFTAIGKRDLIEHLKKLSAAGDRAAAIALGKIGEVA